MEASGGIGSVGKYDVKLSGGVISIDISASQDLAALILAKAAAMADGVEKSILEGAAAILKAMP